ncbi:MAG: NAD(P)-binding domain-containing protein [Pseudomonadota bacterium]
MKVGFIGLGNVGAKLAGSLVRKGFDTAVHDLSHEAWRPLCDAGRPGAKHRVTLRRCMTAPSPVCRRPPRHPSCAVRPHD